MDLLQRSAREVVEPFDGVHLATLLAGESMSFQYYRFEPGARVPEHDHPHEQGGYVTEGVLTFETDTAVINGEPAEGRVRASVDDAYVVPGGEPHAAVNETDGLVEGLDVFSPPRESLPWG